MKAAAAVLALLAWRAPALAAVTSAAIVSAAAAAPRPPALGCQTFIEAFTRATAGRKIVFERPLNITRGFFGEDGDLDVRVLSTGVDDVEGTLKCKGDAFRRFEVRIGVPADDRVLAAYRAYEDAALVAAFGWERAKVGAVVGALTADADEYLRASIQREDTYKSGKVEYHQGDAMDLGVIWTEDDRTLVVTTQDAG